MKYCTSCGAENLDTARFCTKCGGKHENPPLPGDSPETNRDKPRETTDAPARPALPQPPPASARPPRRRRPLVLIVGVLVVGLLIASAGLCYIYYPPLRNFILSKTSPGNPKPGQSLNVMQGGADAATKGSVASPTVPVGTAGQERRETAMKDRSLTEIRALADKGDASAQNSLGDRYSVGRDVSEDKGEAAKWYRKAAEQNFAEAQDRLGNCYAEGEGVSKDMAEAVKWYRKATEQNFAEAQYSLGDCYAEGKGVTKDPAEAVRWYRKAAEQNYTIAQSVLGNCYRKGIGVVKDPAEAAKWYRKAAEDEPFARNDLGVCYANGWGVTKDMAEATKWWLLALSNCGLDQAYRHLIASKRFMMPSDFMEGNLRARDWLEQHKDKSYGYAIGFSFNDGFLVAKDPITAYGWISYAATKGQEQAIELLKRMDSTLSSSDLIAARNWAKELKSRKAQTSGTPAKDGLDPEVNRTAVATKGSVAPPNVSVVKEESSDGKSAQAEPADAETKGSAARPPSPPPPPPQDAQPVRLGGFTLYVPLTWKPFAPGEKKAMETAFQEQLKKMYEQFSGEPLLGITVELVAYRSAAGGIFQAVKMSVPAQADMMAALMKEAPAKVKWGIERGLIKRATEVQPVDRDGFVGFQMELEGANGSSRFMGGLMHASCKTEIIELQFTAAKGEEAAAETFGKLLASVRLSDTPEVAAQPTPAQDKADEPSETPNAHPVAQSKQAEKYDGKALNSQFVTQGVGNRKCIPITRAQISRVLRSPGGAELGITTKHRWKVPVAFQEIVVGGIKAYSIEGMVQQGGGGASVDKALLPMGPGTIYKVAGDVKFLGYTIKADKSAPLIFVVHNVSNSKEAEAAWETEGPLAQIKFAFDDGKNPKPEEEKDAPKGHEVYLQLVHLAGKGSALFSNGEAVQFQ